MQFDVTRYWYHSKINLFVPFSWLFAAIVAIRRFCYSKGWLRVERVAAPVIVVGNITVGGTGKTPFVIWLANWLREQGYRPGIVSRGMGSQSTHQMPHQVRLDNTTDQVGDEALLIVRQTNCPMMICKNRVAAARELLAQTDCNIIISDDGLQHYALARDFEIAIIDGDRRFGNGWLLPAGPLRESTSRLDDVDMVVVNGGTSTELSMRLELAEIVNLACHSAQLLAQDPVPLTAPYKGAIVHGVAGIGNPDRFFQTLRRAGYTVIPHAFPDHYRFEEKDLAFNDDLPVIMTAKDAVKCEGFAKANWWCANVSTKIDERIPTVLSSSLGKMEKRDEKIS